MSGGQDARLPLADVRVIDLGAVWAGPHGTRLLADMGADVIKVESLNRMDPIRGTVSPGPRDGIYPNQDPGARPFNRHGYFNERNRNKRSLTLDLKAPPTREAFERLVAVSDVVLDNFAAGVMDRLGYGYRELAAINPRIIVVQMPSFGTTGPEAPYVGFGATNDQLSGLVAITGYEGEGPQNLGINAGDPVAGAHAAIAVLAALELRRQTGRGAFVDLSHRESATRFLAREVLDYVLNGRIAGPRGNRHPYWAPHAVYRCRPPAGRPGHDEEPGWLALTCRGDADWASLVDVITDEEPALADPLGDADFATALRRWRNQHRLNALIGGWAAHHEVASLADRLAAAGVPAAPVQGPREYFVDPHLRARDWWQHIEAPDVGAYDYYGISWRNARTPGVIRRPAPTLGEHNVEILVDLLGYSEAEYQALIDAGLVGTDPRTAGET